MGSNGHILSRSGPLAYSKDMKMNAIIPDGFIDGNHKKR